MNDRPVLGRRHWQGLSIGARVTLDSSSSLLIVGPTQSGKSRFSNRVVKEA
jgi:hypothetical protein